MSGPGKQYDGYRCDACRRRKNRCEDCRAARAAATRERMARKRAAGICVQCAEDAVKGQSLCELHQKRNNALSGKSHAEARAND